MYTAREAVQRTRDGSDLVDSTTGRNSAQHQRSDSSNVVRNSVLLYSVLFCSVLSGKNRTEFLAVSTMITFVIDKELSIRYRLVPFEVRCLTASSTAPPC